MMWTVEAGTAIALLTIVANGAVTYGVVKTTLRFLEKENQRIDDKASSAHTRIDQHVHDFHSRRPAR